METFHKTFKLNPRASDILIDAFVNRSYKKNRNALLRRKFPSKQMRFFGILLQNTRANTSSCAETRLGICNAEFLLVFHLRPPSSIELPFPSCCHWCPLLPCSSPTNRQERRLTLVNDWCRGMCRLRGTNSKTMSGNKDGLFSVGCTALAGCDGGIVVCLPSGCLWCETFTERILTGFSKEGPHFTRCAQQVGVSTF